MTYGCKACNDSKLDVKITNKGIEFSIDGNHNPRELEKIMDVKQCPKS